MKFIFYRWGGLSENILESKIKGMGHQVTAFSRKCSNYTRDLSLAGEMIALIHSENAQAVISYNYIPIISMVCKTTGIPYYSWIYDSPHHTLFARAVVYDCNRIGCFDRDVVRRLSSMGIDTVRHLPLGFDGSVFNVSKPAKKYEHDISFVGNLYTDIYAYYDNMNIPPDVRERADCIIEKGCFEYQRRTADSFFIGEEKNHDDKLSERVKDVLQSAELLPGDDYYEDVEYIFETSVLEKKITIEERKRLCCEIADRGYDFALYTDSDVSAIPKLKRVKHGYVDYYREMPQVFIGSKINLNITLRSIHTGIPLRAMDIMGCGGFLLSNYQEELSEYFVEGKEMVMFYGLEDCFEKIEYYLKHEEERIAIAQAGREAVLTRFDYTKQLKDLLSL